MRWHENYVDSAGRKIVDVALPGDTEGLLKYKIREALRREARFTREERDTIACTRFQLHIGMAFCAVEQCTWCGGGDTWAPWEIFGGRG